LSALIFSMSVGVAHADPGFVIAESQVRAGDAVHFSITGAEGHVTYEIEVGGRDVLKGAGDGGAASGQFTLPDFGGTAKALKVEADITDSDDKTEVTRTLQYLGAALPPPPPAAAPDPAPALPQQTPAAPATTKAPAARGPAAKVPAKSKPRKHTRERRKVKQQRAVSRKSGEHKGEKKEQKEQKDKDKKHKKDKKDKDKDKDKKKTKDPASDQKTSDHEKQPAHTPLFGTAASGAGGEPATAILLPGLLGLAGFLLLGATIVVRLRRKR
jgi:hypothetical protein